MRRIFQSTQSSFDDKRASVEFFFFNLELLNLLTFTFRWLDGNIIKQLVGHASIYQ